MPEAQARLAAAQASLETGYGRSVKGNNYFGIKAGRSWDGPVVNFRTWESEGGKRKNIRDSFRAYDSLDDSIKDWQALTSRRWPTATTAKTFDKAKEGLRYGRRGGYATDPDYGSKLSYINRRFTGGGLLAPEFAPAGPRQKPDAVSPSSGEMLAAIYQDMGPGRRSRVTGLGSPINSEDVVPGGAPVTPVERGLLADIGQPQVTSVQAIGGGSPGFTALPQTFTVAMPAAPALPTPKPTLRETPGELPPLDDPISIPERQIAEPLPEIPAGEFIPERVVAPIQPIKRRSGLLKGLKTPQIKPSRLAGAVIGSAIGGPAGALVGGLVGPQLTRLAAPSMSNFTAGWDQGTPTSNAIAAATAGGGFNSNDYWREYARSGGGTSALDFSKAEARRRSEQRRSTGLRG